MLLEDARTTRVLLGILEIRSEQQRLVEASLSQQFLNARSPTRRVELGAKEHRDHLGLRRGADRPH
jgi:hypothetical protein